jgi:hypothetical protein
MNFRHEFLNIMNFPGPMQRAMKAPEAVSDRANRAQRHTANRNIGGGNDKDFPS